MLLVFTAVLALFLCYVAVAVAVTAGRLYRRSYSRFIYGLTDEQKVALSAERVKFKRYRRGEREGVLVRLRDVERVCQALNVYVLTTLESTDEPAELVLQASVPENRLLSGFQVRFFAQRFGVQNPQTKELVVKLLRDIVLPEVHRNINVWDVEGTVHEPAADEGFHVYVHSVPSRSERVATPDYLFGYRFRSDTEILSESFRPSGQGIPLSDPESGIVYGEVVGTSLFLLVPAMPTTAAKLAVLARMLQTAVPELDTDTPLENALAKIPNDGAGRDSRDMPMEIGFSGHRRKAAVTLLQHVLLPVVRGGAYIRDCKGAVQRPDRYGPFQVLYHARPSDVTTPTGDTVPLIIQGAVVGELCEKAVYVYADVLGVGRREDVARFADVLLLARRELLIGRAENARALIADLFVQECRQLASLDTTGVEEPAVGAVVAESEKRLRETLKSARHKEAELLRMHGDPEHIIGLEYDSLLRIKKVKNVVVTESELIVDTNMLYCTEPQSRVIYRIGEFKIHIPLEPYGRLKFLNQTQKVHGMNAPHVSGDGAACLGSEKDMFPDLIRKREFASAVNLAIVFLESVNVDDVWGARIVEWPVESGRVQAIGSRLAGRRPTGGRRGLF